MVFGRHFFFLAATTFPLAFAAQSMADIYYSTSEKSDGSPYGTVINGLSVGSGVERLSNSTLNIGSLNGKEYNVVLLFKVPTQARKYTVTHAELTFTAASQSNKFFMQTFDVELYGLTYRLPDSQGNVSVLASDFYEGNATNPPGATLLSTDSAILRANTAYSSSIKQQFTTDTLAAYINQQISAANNAKVTGDIYLVLRFNAASIPGTDRNIMIASGDLPPSSTQTPPILSFTLSNTPVPESATLTLLASGSALLLRRRRV